jgi:hypothetical protein
LTNTFSYKNLDLSVFFQAQFGNITLNNNSFFTERSGASETNHSMRVYERRWRQPGDITDWPRMYADGFQKLDSGTLRLMYRASTCGLLAGIPAMIPKHRPLI